VSEERAAWMKALEEKFAAKPEDEDDKPMTVAAPATLVEKAVVVVEAATTQPQSEWMPAAKAEAHVRDTMTPVLTPTVAPSTQPKPTRPTRSSDLLGAARSAVQANTPESAIAHYRKAIRANKNVDEVLTDVMALAATQPSREWFVLLGEAYTSKGKIEAALEAYRKAQEMTD
jgi:tetratricopeptide (TPR) repeat protein